MKVTGWARRIIIKYRNTVKEELQIKKEVWPSVLRTSLRQKRAEWALHYRVLGEENSVRSPSIDGFRLEKGGAISTARTVRSTMLGVRYGLQRPRDVRRIVRSFTRIEVHKSDRE